MYGRKLVIRIEVDEDETLRGRIDAAVHWDQKAIVAKDVHLIEAAIATDRLVTSRDKEAREAFGNASDNVGELRQIVWVNPTQADEKPIDWLRNGAKTEAHRQLGA
jgi:geranylgeranyl pyrophosphate synthase